MRMLGRKTEQSIECVWIHFTVVQAPFVPVCFCFIFYTVLRGDSVSVEVGQEFLCNMLYNCINNKSETI